MANETTDDAQTSLPTAAGWYWIRNPAYGERIGADRWTVIYIRRLTADADGLKKGELAIDDTALPAFARRLRVNEFIGAGASPAPAAGEKQAICGAVKYQGGGTDDEDI